MPHYRITEIDCPTQCGGKIGYFKDTDTWKCLKCGTIYHPEKEPSKGKPAQLAQQTYFGTEKGIKARKKYKASPKGKIAQARHDKSTKAKLSRRKYYYSDKGQDAHERRTGKVKLFKKIKKFLEENPDKTVEDFHKEHPNAKKA